MVLKSIEAKHLSMSQAKLENTVIVILIMLGVGLGIYFRTAGDNQLSAVLFSLAFASVLYKFLGGTGEENGFQVGVMKFGGSAAVLGGFIYLLSQIVFANDTVNCPDNELLNLRSIPNSGWYIADTKTGEPIEIELGLGDTTLQLPQHQVRYDRIKTRRYQLKEFENEHFFISPLGSESDTLGQVYLSDILGESLSNSVQNIQAKEAYVFKLYPNRGGSRTSAEIEDFLKRTGRRESIFPFPFIIKSYGTLYSIKLRSGETLYSDREILQKNPFIIPEKKADGTTDYWLLDIVHANFLNADISSHYMEWVVNKVVVE